MSDTQANSVSFVRETMLPEQEPPVTERGVIKWARENLFSSWLNIVLTIVGAALIYFSLRLVLPWAFGGVWNAGSLNECRQVLYTFYKSSHGGACWAVIEDRWLQLIFGFYPPTEYWRPILAFVLLFVALAPVLFGDRVPAKMMWFSLAYPFVAAWLIWGGSVWGPILIALGFVAGFVAYKFADKIAGGIVATIAAIAAAVIWWMVITPMVGNGLNTMIGKGRMESTAAQLDTRLAALPNEIAEVEAQADALNAEIAAKTEERDALLAQMVEARQDEALVTSQIEPRELAARNLNGVAQNLGRLSDALGAREPEEDLIARLIGDIQKGADSVAGNLAEDIADTESLAGAFAPLISDNETGLLDILDGLTPTTEIASGMASLQSATAGLTAESAGDLDGMADAAKAVASQLNDDVSVLDDAFDFLKDSNAPELKEPREQLLSMNAHLAGLRDQGTVYAQAAFRLGSERTEARGLSQAIAQLPGREEELPDLKAAEAEAYAALPRSLRGLINVNQLPEGASSDDEALLTEALRAKSDRVGIESAIQDTYASVGRVGLMPVQSREIGGFMLAVIIGVAGIVLSLPLGILLALGRQSHLFIINKVSVGFIEIIRGVPLIVWLFTASLLLNYFLPPGSNFDLMLRVIIMVTLFSSAYIAEVVRGGLAALPKGQYEGADSLGLSYWQSMRLIILPQALKISIPGIVNSFIGLFKDTTLVMFIGLLDPIGLSNAIRADTDWNGVYWELFVFIGLMFFIFCFSMGRYSLFLEKKLQREHR